MKMEQWKNFKVPERLRRTGTLLGLCGLLVLSSAWGAEQKKAQTINLPVSRVSQSVETGGIVAGETASSSAAVLGSFATYKLEMDAAREQSLRMLDDLIADEKADPTTVEQARTEKLALSKAMASEAALQGLLAARGYGESYITVQSGSINVVVNNPGLTEAQIASILEMVTRETGESAENVKIIATK